MREGEWTVAGKIVNERGGVNMGGGALIHTTVQYEDGAEVTIGTSYHEEIAEGNHTVVFEGRESFVLMFGGALYDSAIPAHVETVLKALEANSIADLREKLGVKAEEAAAPDQDEFEAMLNEVLGGLLGPGFEASEEEGGIVIRPVED